MAHPSVADRLASQPWTGTRPTSDWLSCARDMAERKHEHYIHRIPRLDWHPYIDEKVRKTSKKHGIVECPFANSDKTFSGRDFQTQLLAALSSHALHPAHHLAVRLAINLFR